MEPIGYCCLYCHTTFKTREEHDAHCDQCKIDNKELYDAVEEEYQKLIKEFPIL